MAFSCLYRVARKVVLDKSVYKIVGDKALNRYCISSVTLNQKCYLSTMPPKRKRENASVKVTAAAVADLQDEENQVDDNETTGRPSRKRATKKEFSPPPSSESAASDEDSDSDYDKPKKRAKKPKKTPKKDGNAKAQRGRKKAKKEESDSGDGDDEENGDAKPSKGRKKVERKAPEPAKNKTSTTYSEIDFSSCPKKNSKGESFNFKISNWNVDGIRAWLKKGGLEYIEHENPDVFCLQETKCSVEKLPAEVKEVDGYKVYWHCSAKDGYAGVALYSKVEPISVQYGVGDEEHDDEGRIITAEYDKFYVISVYVPNAGRGLVTLPKRLKWNDVFRNFVAQLDKKKPVIVCGDMNVAHLEIDLANPKTNTKNAGFTKEERDGMTDFLSDGYIDTFRELYPDKTQAYTFWTYMSNCRAKNVGWRLDYFLVSKRLMESICDNIIRSEVFGSDHCPITLFLNV